MNYEKLYRLTFFLGYVSVLVVTFVPVFGNLSSIEIGPDIFKIRLDFFLHFAVYFVICLYYLVGLKFGYTLFRKNAFPKFLSMLFLLAILTEVVQIWIPLRSFNIFDLLSNIFGIIIGMIVIYGSKTDMRRDKSCDNKN